MSLAFPISPVHPPKDEPEYLALAESQTSCFGWFRRRDHKCNNVCLLRFRCQGAYARRLHEKMGVWQSSFPGAEKAATDPVKISAEVLATLTQAKYMPPTNGTVVCTCCSLPFKEGERYYPILQGLKGTASLKPGAYHIHCLVTK